MSLPGRVGVARAVRWIGPQLILEREEPDESAPEMGGSGGRRGLGNAVIGSVLRFVSFPLTVLTLGLSLLVVNAVLLLITAELTDALRIDGFGSAVLAGLVISVLSTVLNRVIRVGR